MIKRQEASVEMHQTLPMNDHGRDTTNERQCMAWAQHLAWPSCMCTCKSKSKCKCIFESRLYEYGCKYNQLYLKISLNSVNSGDARSMPTLAGGGGHIISPLSSTKAPLTASSLWSMKKWSLCLVKGPMDSRNLDRLLLYRVLDWVGRRLGRSVYPMQVTPCTGTE